MGSHLYILTGASRGMGAAMARQLLTDKHSLLCISRKPSDTLAGQARSKGAQLEQWPLDLEHSLQVGAMLEQWLRSRKPGAYAGVTLINNASVMPRIGPLSAADGQDLSRALRVGLEAPMLLAAAFLRVTETWGVPRRLLNISSGFGRRAVAAQAAYCAAKAGMDHFTRCVALEEAGTPNGARVCSLAPGVIDTDMQHEMRSADAAAFPDRPKILELKARGQLSSAADAAARVLAYLARPDFGANPVADVRDPSP